MRVYRNSNLLSNLLTQNIKRFAPLAISRWLPAFTLKHLLNSLFQQGGKTPTNGIVDSSLPLSSLVQPVCKAVPERTLAWPQLCTQTLSGHVVLSNCVMPPKSLD